MTPSFSLVTAIVLVLAIAGREALRVTGLRERWLWPATVVTVVLTMVWLAFAAQRLLVLRAGGV